MYLYIYTIKLNVEIFLRKWTNLSISLRFSGNLFTQTHYQTKNVPHILTHMMEIVGGRSVSLNLEIPIMLYV